MLSDYERRELKLIEQGLEADPRLAASLDDVPRRRRWPVRLLTCLAVLLIATGMLANTGGLILQGTIAAGAAIAWARWPAWWAAQPARERRTPT